MTDRYAGMSDQALLAAYQDGDQRAFAFFVQRYLPSVYRFLHRMVGDGPTAEDLAQETFVKAWQKIGAYRPDKPFKAWVFTIARHTAIDFLRKKNPATFSDLDVPDGQAFEETLADARPLAPELLMTQETGQDLERALATLPPESREVVLLHGVEDLTFQEIADQVKQPMNTVKSRYRRALASLQAVLRRPHQNT
jgi:RNA polymerase sigma-70 factor (ECF subfamily)